MFFHILSILIYNYFRILLFSQTRSYKIKFVLPFFFSSLLWSAELPTTCIEPLTKEKGPSKGAHFSGRPFSFMSSRFNPFRTADGHSPFFSSFSSSDKASKFLIDFFVDCKSFSVIRLLNGTESVYFFPFNDEIQSNLRDLSLVQYEF